MCICADAWCWWWCTACNATHGWKEKTAVGELLPTRKEGKTWHALTLVGRYGTERDGIRRRKCVYVCSVRTFFFTTCFPRLLLILWNYLFIYRKINSKKDCYKDVGNFAFACAPFIVVVVIMTCTLDFKPNPSAAMFRGWIGLFYVLSN